MLQRSACHTAKTAALTMICPFALIDGWTWLNQRAVPNRKTTGAAGCSTGWWESSSGSGWPYSCIEWGWSLHPEMRPQLDRHPCCNGYDFSHTQSVSSPPLLPRSMVNLARHGIPSTPKMNILWASTTMHRGRQMMIWIRHVSKICILLLTYFGPTHCDRASRFHCCKMKTMDYKNIF